MRPAPGYPPAMSPPSRSAPLPRKAFTIGDVVGHTFSAWWRHVVVFSLLSLGANLPVLLVALLGGLAVPGVTAPNPNPFDRAALATTPALPQGFWLAYGA